MTAGTTCRASAGVCDPAETCTGSVATCPTDARTAAGTVCRASAGVCDVSEACDGTSVGCPTDAFLPSSTVCRASTTPLNMACDPQETCTGSAAACPADTVIRVPTTETCNSVDDNCNGVIDDPYRVYPVSCAAINRTSPSGMYVIDPDGAGAIAPYQVYCDMTTSGGGWTQALKADGRATTFVYDSANWTTATTVGTSVDNSFVEVKSSAFNNVSLNQLLVGMTGNGYNRTVQLTVSTYSSLQTLFSGGTVSTGLGRAAWLGLVPNSTLQPNCNAEGININPAPSSAQRVRIGILGNNEADCATPDSRLGIGGYGDNCATLLNQSVGNTTRCGGSNGDADVTTYGYVFVRNGSTAVTSWIGGTLSTACTVGIGACARTGTFVCRADGNGTQCSVTAGSATTETCNGIDDDCNGIVDDIAATACSLGACSTGELRCPLTTAGTAVAAVCVRTGYIAAGTTCRASAGPCDAAEVCGGTSDACPADTFVAAGTLCRASAGVCDPAETCTGSAAACPTNVFTAAGTVCRASAGVCDVAETCTGSTATCPTDGYVTAGTTCRASAGVCDVAETCTGAGPSCPGDSFVGAGTVCRASTTPANMACDPQETCTGVAAACPPDTVLRTPTAEVCNAVDDNCNGTIDEGPSTSCAAPINLGSVAAGATVTRNDYIPATAGAEQWYLVNFPQTPDYASHGTGIPQILFASADASVRFDIQTSCGVAGSCGQGGASSGLTSWSFVDSTSVAGTLAYTTRNTTWPTTVYVRVYRVSAPTTCANQTLVVTRPTGVGFTAGFTAGVAPSATAICTNWNDFRAGINPSTTYSSISVSGSANQTGLTCTGAAANALCQALRTGVATTQACAGRTWIVDTCAGIELVVDPVGASGCTCSAANSGAFALRPCHTDGNWGGVNGSICGSASQMLRVYCQ